MTSIIEELGEALANKRPEEIRNVCLIAHVDHGKTSLADSLVSVNAVISNRMAGRLRFMDSREDEQTRGITMKSSGISLLCGPLLVNLMDSPGHVDFSSEVTSALLISDIALLLVDAVEGVCSQTQALLRQAIVNGQSLILVINKLDRLCVELKMSPAEAYQHLVRLLEAVNSCVSQVVAGMILEDDAYSNLDKIELRLHFEPTKGNVLFSSAIHGYAFSVEDFADVYAEKLKIEKRTLQLALFGDFYVQGGSVKEGAAIKGKRTLFEQLILEPLWALHDCALIEPDLAKLLHLAEKLQLSFKSRRVEDAFDEVMRQWMPVARACLRAAARQPSAKVAFTDERLRLLLGRREHPLWELIKNCSAEGETVLAVVKFMRHNDEKVAICRVLSGQVKPNDVLYVTGAKKLSDEDAIPSTTIEKVFMLRGRECIPLQAATAGVICAIQAKSIVQNATLCSSPVKEGLQLGREQGEPLVRVSINTAELDQIDELKRTLKLLTVLDPSLRVLELETGELAMVTAGEVHLQKCLKDLEDMGIQDLEVSPPIVPFLETVVPDPLATAMEHTEKFTECRIRGEALYLRLRVAPLPIEVVQLLEKSRETLKGQAEEKEVEQLIQKLRQLCQDLLPQMKGTWWYRQSRDEIGALIDRIWCFGPDKARANILINCVPDYDRGSIWRKSNESLRPFDNSIISGFQLFVGSGPLCNEAMRGVVALLEGWSFDESDAAVGGQMISAMKATCRAATEKLGTLRLVAAMYRCMVTTSSQSLGKVHSVLAQRKAKVISEDINEATGFFEVEALLPVVESFSFCDHLRKSTSGMASAQLEFSHWEVIEEDPYWTPSTLEEIEEFGLKGDSPNHARGYMDAVRKRKGLPTEDLIVVSADKQRNLNKKK